MFVLYYMYYNINFISSVQGVNKEIELKWIEMCSVHLKYAIPELTIQKATRVLSIIQYTLKLCILQWNTELCSWWAYPIYGLHEYFTKTYICTNCKGWTVTILKSIAVTVICNHCAPRIVNLKSVNIAWYTLPLLA